MNRWIKAAWETASAVGTILLIMAGMLTATVAFTTAAESLVAGGAVTGEAMPYVNSACISALWAWTYFTLNARIRRLWEGSKAEFAAAAEVKFTAQRAQALRDDLARLDAGLAARLKVAELRLDILESRPPVARPVTPADVTDPDMDLQGDDA